MLSSFTMLAAYCFVMFQLLPTVADESSTNTRSTAIDVAHSVPMAVAAMALLTTKSWLLTVTCTDRDPVSSTVDMSKYDTVFSTVTYAATVDSPLSTSVLVVGVYCALMLVPTVDALSPSIALPSTPASTSTADVSSPVRDWMLQLTPLNSNAVLLEPTSKLTETAAGVVPRLGCSVL